MLYSFINIKEWNGMEGREDGGAKGGRVGMEGKRKQGYKPLYNIYIQFA